MRLNIDVQMGATIRLLDRMESIADLSAPLSQCGTQAQRSIQDNFAAGGRPEEWPGISSVTAALRTNPTSPPLTDTGHLESSIQIWNVSANEVVVGPVLHPFASIHQHGATITAKKKIMAREITTEQADLLKTMGRRVSYSKKNATAYIVFGKKVTIPPRPFAILQNPVDVMAFNSIFHTWINLQLNRA